MKRKIFFTFFPFFLLPFFLSGSEKLFQWNYKIDGKKVIVTVDIKKNSYLYKESTSIKFSSSDTMKLLTEPVSVKYKDDMGEVEVYMGPGKFIWEYLFQDPSKIKGKMDIAFQGCRKNENGSGGICLMPEEKSFSLSPHKGSSSENDGKISVKTTNDGIFPSYTIMRTAAGYKNKAEFLSFLKGEKEEKSLFTSFEGKNIFLILLLVFAGGFALNLTPCVLPMIPVNLAIIGAGSRVERSRKEKVLRGCIYGLGITLAYGILGIIAVLSGSSFGAVDSHWLFQGMVSVIFLLLALSMFDVFLLDISRFRSKLKLPTGSAMGFAGIFILGMVAAILAGACVAPVVAAALLESSRIYNGGNPAGLLLLFVLGAGMALPWPVAAAGIAVLPKPGKWMKYIKYAFGVVILLLALNSAYLSFTLFYSHYSRSGKDVSNSLQAIYDGIKRSSQTGGQKMVLIDFWARWCKNCLEMDRSIFQDEDVKNELKNFIFIKFDATNMQSEEVQKVLKEFDIKGLPSFVILKGK